MKSLEELTAQIDLEVVHLPIGDLRPHQTDGKADNPNSMTASEYDTLLSEIRDHGFTQPILVRALPEGGYEILDGHHRWSAVSELGYATIPCVTVEANDDEAMILMVGMNFVRGSLQAVELAGVVASLRERGVSQEVLQQRWGMTGTRLNELSGFTDPPAVPPVEKLQPPDGKTVSVRCTNDEAAIVESVLDFAAPEKGERGAALARICQEWAASKQQA